MNNVFHCQYDEKIVLSVINIKRIVAVILVCFVSFLI